ncbi:Dam family site-specific DNA-(adenine-N6)-methyltransferase [candidate division KSB1 bacterium]|nr:Dam family site-specific DNA-(adenine-N6)-methyltransferase [candidate division KSB1 bacterium]
MKNNGHKPFLRWAGGKRWFLKEIGRFLPEKINNYHEPFLGGGSVFFFLKPENVSYLSDSNTALINAYIQVRDNLTNVYSILETFENNKDEYYKIRETVYDDTISQAAQFIYLNRTNFNGIYRVNLKGEYNVPYGFKEYKVLFDYDVLLSASKILQNVILKAKDFEHTINLIKEDDFVFLDPPYTVTHVKNGFIKYNEKLFSWEDQKRLAETIRMIKSKGAYYLLTNANHESVEKLYGEIDKPISIQRYSVIGGKKAKRGEIQEFVFTNVNNGVGRM